ncbi:P-type conjugative transfer protein TrbJ [Yersinia kristensenii]|uniref:P-type conjugative transfer protein TrbJ n=1 Tax=Yersinia kristensenii TaxID=28152 RepID=UPI0012FDDAFA|nr:P-type conjugative transfer protein TrbJ [Yersinia kristensenii]
MIIRNFKALLCLGSFGLLWFPFSASAIFCSNCATNIQAAQSYVKEVESVVHQVTSLQHEVESIGYQVQNLKNIGQHDWGQAIQQINRLGDIARQGDSLAFSLADINDEWQRRFQGYEGWSQNGTSPAQVSEKYRLWGDTMRDTAKSSLNVAAEMAKVQSEDEQTLTTLQNHSSSATGALQAAQAGNELVAQTTRQMQKIQTLLQTDIQMTATSMATATEQAEQKRAATDAGTAKPQVDPDDGLDWSKPWNDKPHKW